MSAVVEFEWPAPDGTRFAAGAFASAVGKTWNVGEVEAATVVRDGEAVLLRVRVSDEEMAALGLGGPAGGYRVVGGSETTDRLVGPVPELLCEGCGEPVEESDEQIWIAGDVFHEGCADPTLLEELDESERNEER